MWQDLLVATLGGGKKGFNSAPRRKYVISHSFSQGRGRKKGQIIQEGTETFRKTLVKNVYTKSNRVQGVRHVGLYRMMRLFGPWGEHGELLDMQGLTPLPSLPGKMPASHHGPNRSDQAP